MGSISDVLLLYSPNGGYFDQTYNFMNDIGFDRLLPAQLIGVPFLPFQILGFIAIYLLYKKELPKLSLTMLALSSWAMCMGTAYHGMLAFVNIYKKSEGLYVKEIFYEENLGLIRMLNEPFAAFVVIGFTISCLIIAWGIFKSNILPKWVAFCVPTSFYALIGLLYIAGTSAGTFLVMTGFNLSIGLFFIVVLSQLNKVKIN